MAEVGRLLLLVIVVLVVVCGCSTYENKLRFEKGAFVIQRQPVVALCVVDGEAEAPSVWPEGVWIEIRQGYGDPTVSSRGEVEARVQAAKELRGGGGDEDDLVVVEE